MSFPSSLDSFPSAATLAAHTLATDPHSTLHGNLGTAVAALEAKVGVDSSAVTTSVDYLLTQKQPLDGDLTALAALSATNAIYYRSAANTWTQVTIGSGLDFTGGTLSAPGSVSGANPTASVGLSAVNGSAGTFLRSDGAPALSQSITPTWTGQHTFQGRADFAAGSVAAPKITFGQAAHGIASAVNPGYSFDLVDGSRAWWSFYNSFAVGILASDASFNWANGTDLRTAVGDVGLKRAAANVLVVTDAGTTADTAFGLRAKSSTTSDRDRARLVAEAVDNTDATRKYRLRFDCYDTAAREAIRIEADGAAARLGFYGVTAVARQVLATGAGATVDQVITALQNLGLVKQS